MALNKEVWLTDIQEALYPENAFYTNSIDDSLYVTNKTVHLPISGTIPSVTVDRSSFPASATQRTDTELTYTMKELSTDPMFITTDEQTEISYEKRASILRDMINNLNDRVALELAYAWGNDLWANQVETSGSARSAYLSYQTGTRLALDYADILKASYIMNAQNVPIEGRKMLISAGMFNDLLNISEFQYSESLMTGIITSGAVGRVLGFDVFVRSQVLQYDNAYTTGGTAAAKADIGSSGTTYKDAAICWHPQFVRRAMGTMDNGGVKVFVQEQNPLYYGDLLSALIRVGGSTTRTSEIGIVTIIEK